MSELKYKPGVLIIEGYCEIEGFNEKEKVEKIYDCLTAIHGNFDIPAVLHVYAKDKRFKILTAEDVVTNEEKDIIDHISFYAQGYLSACGIVYKEDL